MSFNRGWRSHAEGDQVVLQRGDIEHRFDLTRCPNRYVRATHWREDGRCHCDDAVKRWPFATLEAWCRTRAAAGGAAHPGVADVAELLHVDRRQVFRLRERVLLTDAEADSYATRLGEHPVAIWRSWFTAAPLELVDA